MSLLDLIRQRHRDDHESHFSEYVSLIATNSETTDPDVVSALAVLMDRLGITPEQAERDHQAIVEYRRLQAEAKKASDLRKQAHEANEKHLAVCAERQKLWALMNDRVKEASEDKYAADNALASAETATRNLDKLRSEHPAVLSAVDALPRKRR